MALNINIKALNERKNELITRVEGITEKALNEKRDLTDDELKEITEIREEVKGIKNTLKLADDFEALNDIIEKRDDGENNDGEGQPTPEEIEAQEVRAFDAYVRGIVLNNRDAGNLTKTDNGAIIPVSIAKRIIKKVYDICPILEKSNKYNVKGTLEIPYYDETEDSITVAFSEEFKALPSHAGKFKTISLTGYLAGALTLISISLINNAQFNVVDFIVEHMAFAIKLFIEDVLLNGKGSVTALSDLTNSITTAAATAITADEIIRLKDKVKDAYQNNAMWIMSTETRTAVRLLKDSNGNYLLQDDISSPFGSVLLGKPVYPSDAMKDIGAGNTCIYYGEFNGLATKFNEEINIQVLREKYADQHAVGVIGWFEFDSKVEDAQKIAKLVCAES